MRIILALFILLTIFSCGQTGNRIKVNRETSETKSDSIYVDMTSIAIIPFDTTYLLFEKAQPTDLNTQELQLIEKLIFDCISQYNPGQRKQFEEISNKYPNENFKLSDFIIELNRYKRQYVPVINDKGEKEVWVNCFCDTWDSDWKKEIIEVLDGGNCYFQMKINLTEKKYYDFMVNGVA